jgi:flagellar motility protein MotE (MotC chaperone)
MNTFMREFRLLPIVLFATASLLALKLGGLILSGGYTLAAPRPAQADSIRTQTPDSDLARDGFGFAEPTGSVDKPAADDQSAAGKGDAATPPAGKGDAANPAPAEAQPIVRPASGAAENGRVISAAERAVLERLQERRQELDRRAHELDVREGLAAAAEKRLEARLAEIKDVEARINATMAKKDNEEVARIKSLVTMYENMKPKDAARIFDRLDLKILIEVASQINPRRMSDILAQMTSQAAERLTVELATRSDKAPSLSDLPKIEGRPGG